MMKDQWIRNALKSRGSHDKKLSFEDVSVNLTATNILA